MLLTDGILGCPVVAVSTRTEEARRAPNKLLEVQDAEWVDAGKAGATTSGNPDVAALAPVHRPKELPGQGRIRAKRVQGRGSSAASRTEPAAAKRER